MNTKSPGLPESDGVPRPTVYFLETEVSPCKKILFDSTPLSDLTVSLFETITGPLNSEIASLLNPPSTLIERDKLLSTAEQH
ncbi:hypothetical protein [uncultured phage MedDCM-OCT-S08-C964]|nr:hypothetical protein [uncultured phage MedDCM-OCT-S08-C964]